MTRVEVTETDIAMGERAEMRYCPVALALERATGQPWAVGDTTLIRLDRWCRRLAEVAAPLSVQQFVRDFDDQRNVEPFAFEIPEQIGVQPCSR